MVGIEGTTGSVTGTTHRAEVTEGNELVTYSKMIGNTSPDCTGDDYCVTVDNAGRLHTRGFRNAAGSGRRMLVDSDRHGQVDIDGVTAHESGLVVMTHAHWRVTQCEEYTAGSSFYEVPMNGSASVLFVTGSASAHFNYNVVVDGDFRTALLENTHVSDSGASLGIFNRRRDCVDTISSKMFANPTIGAAGSGDIICNSMLLGGSGAGTKFVSADVSVGKGETDWIFAAGSSYLFTFNNIAGRAATMVWKASLHTHNNG